MWGGIPNPGQSRRLQCCSNGTQNPETSGLCTRMACKFGKHSKLKKKTTLFTEANGLPTRALGQRAFFLSLLFWDFPRSCWCSRFHQNCLEGVVNFSVLKVVSSGSDKFPSFLRHFLPPPCRSPTSYLISGGPPRLLLGLSLFFFFSPSHLLCLFLLYFWAIGFDFFKTVFLHLLKILSAIYF